MATTKNKRKKQILPRGVKARVSGKRILTARQKRALLIAVRAAAIANRNRGGGKATVPKKRRRKRRAK